MIRKLLIGLSFVLFFALKSVADYDDTLNAIEMEKYGQTYNNESISERLMRLETDLFGLSQSGGLENRIQNLRKISNVPYINPVENSYESYQKTHKKSKFKTLWDNLSSTFDTTGTITGFTPPIYDDMYGNSYYQSYNNYGSYSPNYYPNRYPNYFTHRYPNNRYNYSPFNPGFRDRITNNHTPRLSPPNNYYKPSYSSRRYVQTNSMPRYITNSSVHILRD